MSTPTQRDLRFRVWVERLKRHYPIELGAGDDGCFAWGYLDESGNVVEQFTGLRDRDGREIYEGDLVRASYWLEDAFQNKVTAPPVGVVQYVADYATFYCVGKTPAGARTHMSLYSRPAAGNPLNLRFEVIGNIHEHPHLLEVPAAVP